ncbi:MAG: hypothetical protein ACRDT2_23705, partial [Natronosporangium sp.]
MGTPCPLRLVRLAPPSGCPVVGSAGRRGLRHRRLGCLGGAGAGWIGGWAGARVGSLARVGPLARIGLLAGTWIGPLARVRPPTRIGPLAR